MISESQKPQEEFDAMKSTGLGQVEDPLKDAGALAAERIREKGLAYKAKQTLKWTVGLCIFLLLASVGTFGWYAWETRVLGRATDYRECTMMVGDREVTGRRSYSYPYTELLGHRIVDSQKVIEETRMDVRGSAMAIVGLEQNNAGWWSVHVGTGEQGIQMLKPAAIYTVVMDKKTGVIEYSEFCK